MVVHLFLNNNKALDFLPINSIKNGGITPELVGCFAFSRSGYGQVEEYDDAHKLSLTHIDVLSAEGFRAV